MTMQIPPMNDAQDSRFSNTKYLKNKKFEPRSPEVEKMLAELREKPGPFTRALKRKSQLRQIPSALTEKVAIIAKKASVIPQKLLRSIKL